MPRDVGDAAGPLGLEHRLSGPGRKVSPVNVNGRDPRLLLKAPGPSSELSS